MKGVSKSLRKGTKSIGTKKRAIAGAVTGLSAASLLAVPQADAAQEVRQLAASKFPIREQSVSRLVQIKECKSACMKAHVLGRHSI